MKTIGTCGFCSTGSSAVSDYLKEFDENQVLDNNEFTIAYLPDGLCDLEYHLMKHSIRDDSSSLAIPRFRRFISKYKSRIVASGSITSAGFDELVESYMNSLIQISFRSNRRSDYLLFPSKIYQYLAPRITQKLILPLNRKYGHPITKFFPCRDVEVSVNPECFYKSSKEFIHKLLELSGADFNRNIVLDQAFPGDDPTCCFQFFENPKAIVVDRDPRDNYLFTKKVLYKKHINIMPVDTVEHFCTYYRVLRHNRPYKQEKPNVMVMNFEEMVYDYDNATKKIRDFCDLKENLHPFSIFDPKVSAPNTQLFLRFPEFADDIKYIEKNLSEYLFDFAKYPQPDMSGPMFRGKSPLNK